MGGAPENVLVGRAGESARVAGVLDAAAGGTFGALLVSGESGIGKTELVRAAAAAAGRVEPIWATCLPLTRLRAPLQPLRSAVRGWQIRAALPDQGVDPWSGVGPAPGDPAERFDAWLSGSPGGAPMILVVDDLHWADPDTLDLLMYLLAGPAQRRAAVLMTLRAGPDGPTEGGEAIAGWLADVRKLPRVGEIRLHRLDRFATRLQVAGLLAAEPRESLVEDVWRRTAGHPYWTRLIVEGLSADAASLPAEIPVELSQAVTGPWSSLPDAARRMSTLIAVGGSPLSAAQIGEVLMERRETVVGRLRESVDAGVLARMPDGSYWFTHPLLPEALVSRLLPEERELMHGQYIDVLQRPGTGTADEIDRERAARIAFHHLGAGRPAEAARWSLLAADLAERDGRFAEAVVQLRQISPTAVGPGGTTRRDLLRRIVLAAERAGNVEEELSAIEELLSLDEAALPGPERSRLMVRRISLRFFTGREFVTVEVARKALQAAAGSPDAPEYALAMVQLADALAQYNDPEGFELMPGAMALARSSGSERVLAHALVSEAHAIVIQGGDGLDVAREGARIALEARDWWIFVRGVLWSAYSRGSEVSPEHMQEIRRGREVLVAQGAPHAYQALLSVWEADTHLLQGRWREALGCVRTTLAYSPGRGADVWARLVLAQLAHHQGRFAEAESHLQRAEELVPEDSRRIWRFDVARAELAVSHRDVDAVMSLVPASAEGRLPDHVERLFPLAAQGLADRVRELRDRGEDPQPVLARIRDLRARFPEVLWDVANAEQWRSEMAAMQAWYDAECARAEHEGGHDEGALWLACVEACTAALLPWDELYARYRAASVLLLRPGTRSAGAAQLRRGLELAHDLEADPIRQELNRLATSARVPVELVVSGADGEQTDEVTVANVSLTPREREILGHVVAGRTYAEIARDLVISEKTVSVHVSNLLRKTGTSGRVELAQLVHRTRGPGG